MSCERYIPVAVGGPFDGERISSEAELREQPHRVMMTIGDFAPLALVDEELYHRESIALGSNDGDIQQVYFWAHSTVHGDGAAWLFWDWVMGLGEREVGEEG